MTTSTSTTIIVSLVSVIWSLVVILICAWPLKVAWNRTLPDIFNWKQITFWQAFGLQFIGLLIFGGDLSPLWGLLSQYFDKM
jgi:hypothetical protein